MHTTNKSMIAGEPTPVLESSWHNVRIGEKAIKVNSRHHQGIKELASGLSPIAICEEDGLIEKAIGDKSMFTQWHPERSEVWGSEAESLVYEWMLNYLKPELENPEDCIVNYLKSKNFTVVSNERIRKSINESYSDQFIDNIISSKPRKFKKVIDKKGRIAIKMLK